MGYQRLLRQDFCRVVYVIALLTGKSLKPSVTYKVAVNHFMANGGDDCDTLAAAKN
jgi:hypothetical protein